MTVPNDDTAAAGERIARSGRYEPVPAAIEYDDWNNYADVPGPPRPDTSSGFEELLFGDRRRAAALASNPLDELRAKRHALTPGDTRADAYLAAAIDRECAELAAMGPRSGRNSALNNAALSLGRLPIDREVLRQALLDACAANGVLAEDGERQCNATIDSGFDKADTEPPRTIPDAEPQVIEVAAEELAGAAGVDPIERAIEHKLTALRISREARRRLDAENAPQVSPPPVRNLDALLAEPDAPTAYTIDQLAPVDARVMLSAQYKAGKTTVAGNMMRSLADREPFLGTFAVTKHIERLVLIDTELSPNTMRRWLREQNITNTAAVADVVALRGKLSAFNILDAECRRYWADRLKRLRCDYLFLDCLRPLLDAYGLDENRDAGKFLVPFDELLAEAGVSDAMIVHHMGHNGEHSRGDSRLQDWPDAIWRIVRESDDPASPRYFSAVGRDVYVPEGRLTFDADSRRLTYVSGSRSDAATEAAFTAILAVLEQATEPMSTNAIEKHPALAADHTQRAIRAGLLQAVRSQLVAVAEGPRNAKLHTLASPCSECGKPVASGAERHMSCRDGAVSGEALSW